MSITPIGNEGAWGIGQQTVQRHHPSFTNTASLLGLSSTDLTSQSQPGTTLAELAQRKGVSSSDLLASVRKDLQANAPQGAAAPSDSQLQQFATNIINGTRPSEAGKRAHSNLSSPARTSQLLGSSKAGYGSPLTGYIDGGVARRVRVSSSPSRLDRVSIRAE